MDTNQTDWLDMGANTNKPNYTNGFQMRDSLDSCYSCSFKLKYDVIPFVFVQA